MVELIQTALRNNPIGRIAAGIDKAEDAGTAQGRISSTDALQRVFPTTVVSPANFVAGSARRLDASERQQHLI